MPSQQPSSEVLTIVDDHVVRGPHVQHSIDEFLHCPTSSRDATLPRRAKSLPAALDNVDSRFVGLVDGVATGHHDVAVATLLGNQVGPLTGRTPHLRT